MKKRIEVVLIFLFLTLFSLTFLRNVFILIDFPRRGRGRGIQWHVASAAVARSQALQAPRGVPAGTLAQTEARKGLSTPPGQS